MNISTKSLGLHGAVTLMVLAICGHIYGRQAELSHTYDVVIVGGSSSGVGAAIGAARLGVSVALLVPTPVLGGMLANGIGNVDEYSTQGVSGVYREFVNAVKEYYKPIMKTDPLFQKPWKHRPLPEYFRSSEGGVGPDQGGRWGPHVADYLFKQMVAKYPNITVYYKRHATGVIKIRNRVIGVKTCGATEPNAYAPCTAGTDVTFYGKVIIDATVEGDIAAWAGVPFRVGREARSPREPHAGRIYYYNRTGEIMPGSTGQQDSEVVSYGLRITVQNYTQKEFSKHLLRKPPSGYNPADYKYSVFSGREFNPHGKAEVNMYPYGSELEEVNWNWPDATRAEREHEYVLYENHALGYLYFLQHVRHLPLGLPTDDYTDNGNVPYQVYVREARRIVGEATIDESDIVPWLVQKGGIQPIVSDAIAVAHDPLDSKPTETKRSIATPDKGEGDFYMQLVEPYQVPYGSIVPKEIDGLLVPTALSATHVAYSSVRLDPGWTVIGQAAGVAAAVSIHHNVSVRSVPMGEVQRDLLKQKCELMFYWDLPLKSPAFAPVEWLSVKKIVEGYPDRLFRPKQPLTRAEMAIIVAKALKLWPSISDQYFKDVPPGSEGFQEIETLYDNHALGVFGFVPLWPKDGNYAQHVDPGEGYRQDFGFYRYLPSKPVTWEQFLSVVHDAGRRETISPDPQRKGGEIPPLRDPMKWLTKILNSSTFGTGYAKDTFRPDDLVTRSEACAFIASLRDAHVQPKSILR